MVIQKNKFEDSAIETRNFASASIPTPNGGAELITASATKSENANTSFISRINYSFNDRYLLTTNVRVDGSSIFGPNRRWGIFPSLSLGWRISNEKFFDNVEHIKFSVPLKTALPVFFGLSPLQAIRLEQTKDTNWRAIRDKNE